MIRRIGMGRLFPAALLVLVILSVLNLFGNHRFGGGLPIFLLGCAATGLLFLIGNSLKLSPDTEAEDEVADSDMQAEDHETAMDWDESNLEEERDDALPAAAAHVK